MEALKAPPPKTNPKHLQVKVASLSHTKKNVFAKGKSHWNLNGLMEDSGMMWNGGKSTSSLLWH